uniref:Serine/threonine protein phosphatase 7 long form isogeny n=1 Tax=Cajanus cajan TaxID=3821 RepID=A0A151RZ95_CAJCA|nr:Serine/threonine protein phosphatase 7 long form isogeny [Cajanus cajan]
MAQIMYNPIDHHLVFAFVKHWKSKTHMSHMTFIKCTIMFEDVANLFGLKVDGELITSFATRHWVNLVGQLLRVSPSSNVLSDGILKNWIDRHFFDVSKHVRSQKHLECFSEAFILRIINSFLFVDYSGTYVPLMYLPMLVDLDHYGHTIWGSTILAYMYRELCLSTNYNHKEISGACSLLHE